MKEKILSIVKWLIKYEEPVGLMPQQITQNIIPINEEHCEILEVNYRGVIYTYEYETIGVELFVKDQMAKKVMEMMHIEYTDVKNDEYGHSRTVTAKCEFVPIKRKAKGWQNQ